MTREQARQELLLLAEGVGFTGELTDEEMASWFRVLEPIPYERGRRVRMQLVDTWRFAGKMPMRADFVRIEQSMTQAGYAGADAYSQNGSPPPQDRERIARQIAQMDRWRDMDNDEYFAEVLRMQDQGKIRRVGG